MASNGLLSGRCGLEHITQHLAEALVGLTQQIPEERREEKLVGQKIMVFHSLETNVLDTGEVGKMHIAQVLWLWSFVIVTT